MFLSLSEVADNCRLEEECIPSMIRKWNAYKHESKNLSPKPSRR